jgi:hypothetical protein
MINKTLSVCLYGLTPSRKSLVVVVQSKYLFWLSWNTNVPIYTFIIFHQTSLGNLLMMFNRRWVDLILMSHYTHFSKYKNNASNSYLQKCKHTSHTNYVSFCKWVEK